MHIDKIADKVRRIGKLCRIANIDYFILFDELYDIRILQCYSLRFRVYAAQ